MAGEKIMEAIELADAEREALEAYEEEIRRLGPEKSQGVVKPERSAELKARGDISGEEYVWKTLKSVPAAGMEDALLVLPFRQVVSLLIYLDAWAKNVSQVKYLCMRSELSTEPGYRTRLQDLGVLVTYPLQPAYSEQNTPNAITRPSRTSTESSG